MINIMGTCSAKISARAHIHIHTSTYTQHLGKRTYINTLYVHIKIDQCIAYEENNNKKKNLYNCDRNQQISSFTVLKPGSGTHRRESNEVQSCGVARFIHVYVVVNIYKILLLLNKTETHPPPPKKINFTSVQYGRDWNVLEFRAERWTEGTPIERRSNEDLRVRWIGRLKRVQVTLSRSKSHFFSPRRVLRDGIVSKEVQQKGPGNFSDQETHIHSTQMR